MKLLKKMLRYLKRYGITNLCTPLAIIRWENIDAQNAHYLTLEDDIVTSNGRYLQPSYINFDGEKIVIDKNDGAWNKPVIVGYNSKDGGISCPQTDRGKATVRITDVNI